MRQNTSDKLVPLQTIVPTYKRLFRRDIDFYDSIELAYWALKKIGNLTLDDKVIRLKVKNLKAMMPCDAVKIHAVSDAIPLNILGEYIRRDLNGILINGAQMDVGDAVISPSTVYTPEYPAFDLFTAYYVNDLPNLLSYYRGRLVEYKWEKSYLHFNESDIEVDVLYEGIYMDAEGYPMVTEMTILAICYYINMVNIQASVFNNETVSGAAVQLAEQLWNRHCGQAVVDDGWSANEMDEVFDVLVNHTRKQFGVQLMGL